MVGPRKFFFFFFFGLQGRMLCEKKQDRMEREYERTTIQERR